MGRKKGVGRRHRGHGSRCCSDNGSGQGNEEQLHHKLQGYFAFFHANSGEHANFIFTLQNIKDVEHYQNHRAYHQDDDQEVQGKGAQVFQRNQAVFIALQIAGRDGIAVVQSQVPGFLLKCFIVLYGSEIVGAAHLGADGGGGLHARLLVCRSGGVCLGSIGNGFQGVIAGVDGVGRVSRSGKSAHLASLQGRGFLVGVNASNGKLYSLFRIVGVGQQDGVPYGEAVESGQFTADDAFRLLGVLVKNGSLGDTAGSFGEVRHRALGAVAY